MSGAGRGCSLLALWPKRKIWEGSRPWQERSGGSGACPGKGKELGKGLEPWHQLNIKAINYPSPGLPALPNSSPFNHPCVHPQLLSAAGNCFPSLSDPKQHHPLLCPLPQSLFILWGIQQPERGNFSFLKQSVNDLFSPNAAFSVRWMLLQKALLGIVDLQAEFSLGSKGSLETEFSNTKLEISSF